MKKLLVLFILLFAASSVAVVAQDDSLSQEEIRAIADSVVFIGIIQGNEIVGNGSGTIISNDGLIYTNAHVVEDADDLGIFMLSDIADLPTLRYFATPIFISDQIDFAIIQIDRDAEGNPIDPATQALPVLDIAMAQVEIGDDIRVFGYPGIGDGFMVVTSGEIVTIQNGLVAGERVPVWYRTDTEFSGGNSGGLAVNEQGEIVGIPTWVVSEERTAGKLGGLLPFTTVQTLVNSLEGGGTQLVQPPSQQQQQPEQNLVISLENTSSVNVCFVYISPTTASDWGPDQLGETEVISPGATRTWEFPPNLYDMLLLDCEGETLSDTREVELVGQNITLTFSGGAALSGGGTTFTEQAVPPSDEDTLIGGEALPGGVSVTCTLDSGEVVFDNGVEVVVRQMRAGFTYTATAIGIDGFDPVIAVVDSSSGNGLCDDDTDGAASYRATLPTTGAVGTSNLNSQVNFSQNSGNNMADVSLVVGGFGNTAGEFILVLEGMFAGASDGAGDPFSVRITPGMIASEVPVTLYMLATDNNLDPLFYLADPNTFDPFVDGSGATVICDDAGNADLCWGTSNDLSSSEVIMNGTRALPGGPRDAMLQIPLGDFEVGPDDPAQYITFFMTSFQQQTEGEYIMAFHMATR